jgi:hypothetical protein
VAVVKPYVGFRENILQKLYILKKLHYVAWAQISLLKAKKAQLSVESV